MTLSSKLIKRNPHARQCQCHNCAYAKLAGNLAMDADLQLKDQTGQARKLRASVIVGPPGR